MARLRSQMESAFDESRSLDSWAEHADFCVRFTIFLTPVTSSKLS